MGILKLIPYLNRIHLMFDTELFPTIVVLIEAFKVIDFGLILINGQSIDMRYYLICCWKFCISCQPFLVSRFGC